MIEFLGYRIVLEFLSQHQFDQTCQAFHNEYQQKSNPSFQHQNFKETYSLHHLDKQFQTLVKLKDDDNITILQFLLEKYENKLHTQSSESNESPATPQKIPIFDLIKKRTSNSRSSGSEQAENVSELPQSRNSKLILPPKPKLQNVSSFKNAQKLIIPRQSLVPSLSIYQKGEETLSPQKAMKRGSVVFQRVQKKKLSQKPGSKVNEWKSIANNHPLFKYIRNGIRNDTFLQAKQYWGGGHQQNQSMFSGQDLPYYPINFDEIPILPKAEIRIQYNSHSKQDKSYQIVNFSDAQKKTIENNLKRILVGMRNNDGWNNNITFDKEFIFIRNGASNGIYNCLQCYFIIHYHYLFRLSRKGLKEDQLKKGLRAAMCDILFKIYQKSEQKQIILVSYKKIPKILIPFQLDAFNFISLSVESIQDLYEQLEQHISVFTNPKSYGILLFLYTCIFSKGTEQLISEFGDVGASLLNYQFYCTQECVNLLLTGVATSNCFDGEKVIDETFRMHGIKNKTDIGFLTINEFFRYIEVGSNYKNPNYPIWLIYFNKSYYVIFGWTFQVIREDANLKEFDLVLIAQDLKQLIKVERISQGVDKHMRSMSQGNLNSIYDGLSLILKTKWGIETKVKYREL